MTDGPIIDLPRSEYRWIGETARRIKERLPPMWERVWFFALGLFAGAGALQALRLGMFIVFAVLAVPAIVFIYTTIRPRPLPVKQPESSNTD